MNETVHGVSTILSPMFGLFYSICHNNDMESISFWFTCDN